MMLSEYVGKAIMSKEGTPVPKSKLCLSAEEAVEGSKEFDGDIVLKVQVPAGGRGKSGGIRIVNSRNAGDVRKNVEELLRGKYGGFSPMGILIEERIDVAEEFYASIVIDDTIGRPVLLFSRSGGIMVESQWKDRKNIQIPIDIFEGLWSFRVKEGLQRLDIPSDLISKIVPVMMSIYNVFIKNDLKLLEINPLAITASGDPIILDVKLDVDEDALYRSSQFIRNAVKATSEGSLTGLAREYDLAFAILNETGNIGVISGGAGLGMATLDTAFSENLKPANFLDLGGGVTPQKVARAIEIVSTFKKLKGIFINVYGGINNLEEIGKGIVEAKNSKGLKIPILVKMRGHFEEQALRILEENGIPSISTSNTRSALKLLKEIIGTGIEVQ